MRILIVHNRYRESGGEERVVDAEIRLLRESGLEVRELIFDSSTLKSSVSKIKAAWALPFSHESFAKVQMECRAFRPDILHVHNFFPIATPAVFRAARDAGVRTVLTLHNFRILCSNGLLFRDGRPCELCLDGRVVPGIRHACYQNSHLASAAVARMIRWNRNQGTWRDSVDRFIALNRFSRDRFVRWGLPAEKILVKSNFLFDPGSSVTERVRAPRFLFVGRFSREKGLETLLAAKVRVPGMVLHLVGDGPLAPMVREAAARDASIKWHGRLDQAGVYKNLRESEALIFPSECYENFPMTLLEAMAHSRAVIASRIGAIGEIIREGQNGRLFEAGNADDLAKVISELRANPAEAKRLGEEGRATYISRYTPASNLKEIKDIYGALKGELNQ
jgi:glycosyltransferase involved in cell wall biosynthesis